MSAFGPGEIGLTLRQRRSGVATAAAIAIANRAHCTVTGLGSGSYRIVKSGGAADSWDGSAVSTEAMAGDFTLRLQPATINKAVISGLNSDPTSDDSYLSIDFALDFFSDGTAHIFENGNYVAGGWPYAAGDIWWVIRRGGSLSYVQGGANPDAGMLRRSVGAPATLYFDSSFADIGGTIDVQLMA